MALRSPCILSGSSLRIDPLNWYNSAYHSAFHSQLEHFCLHNVRYSSAQSRRDNASSYSTNRACVHRTKTSTCIRQWSSPLTKSRESSLILPYLSPSNAYLACFAKTCMLAVTMILCTRWDTRTELLYYRCHSSLRLPGVRMHYYIPHMDENASFVVPCATC